MTTPNRFLMQRYGTEAIFQEKLAGAESLLARLAGGLGAYELSQNNQQVNQKHEMQAEAMNEMLRELELAKIDESAQLLRNSPTRRFQYVPGMGRLQSADAQGPSDDYSDGMDAGMVRTASIAAFIGSDLAKEAGLGQLFSGIAGGLKGLMGGAARGAVGGTVRAAKGVAGGVVGAGRSIGGAVSSAAGSVRGAGQSAMGALKAAPGQFGQKLTNLGNRAQSSGRLAGGRLEGAMTGQPSKMVSPLPKPPVPAVSAAAPAAAATTAPAVAPAAVTTAPTTTPTTAGKPSFIDRLKGKANLGWKGNLALAGAAGTALYAGHKILQKGTQVMGEEGGGPANYGGGAQIPGGVNQYGYA